VNDVPDDRKRDSSRISRRSALGRAAGTAALVGAGLSGVGNARAEAKPANQESDAKGKLRQSIAYWCFKPHWSIEQTCRVAKELGCGSVELLPPEDWPTLKKHGLICAMAPSHGFEQGMNNPKYQEMCIDKIKKSVDACAEHGFPNVITFTGFRDGIPDDVGLRNCVEGLKKVIGHAEAKGITLCLEMLNSRVAEEMKGHPGYQGDHMDYCAEIVRKVGSPRMKLLFDIYHVQIMDGDIMPRIRQYKDLIGHYHTAGNPGRCELDSRQEINYRPIMEEIARTGYKGYVGQEFIPTRDPLEGLSEAVALCAG
jgi:hydroxypyruvate isomerase